MHKRLGLTLATAAAATLTGGLLTLSAATATAAPIPGGTTADADFNGDGLDDVVIGASGENGDNGAVYALRSGSDGSLTAPSGIYPSTVGVSGSGTPLLGNNFAD